MIESGGPVAAAEVLHRLVSAVVAATDEHGVSFLASDVDADGGKLILTAGAPSVTGDDEERIRQRLAKAEEEVALAADLEVVHVVNDDLERALAELQGIIDAHRSR